MDSLSKKASCLARLQGAEQVYSTLQAARRLGIRSMTLMRWVAAGNFRCPKKYLMGDNNFIHWLWDEADLRRAKSFKDRATHPS